MNVLQSLTELYNSQNLDSVYRELALKILSNLYQMKRVTIYDIAELTASSRTTVWRLVQKLGYGSFSDFRYALQSAALQYDYYNRMIERHHNFESSEVIEEVQEQLSLAGQVFRSGISAEDLEELTDEISCASKVHFYMPFRSPYIYSFQQNLWKGGKDTEYHCLIPDIMEAVRYLNNKSIVLISTLEYAETMDMTKVFDAVQKKNSVIWLAGNAESRYNAYADRHLLTEKAKPAAWILAFECFILSLSERYRGKYIDK